MDQGRRADKAAARRASNIGPEGCHTSEELKPPDSFEDNVLLILIHFASAVTAATPCNDLSSCYRLSVDRHEPSP